MEQNIRERKRNKETDSAYKGGGKMFELSEKSMKYNYCFLFLRMWKGFCNVKPLLTDSWLWRLELLKRGIKSVEFHTESFKYFRANINNFSSGQLAVESVLEVTVVEYVWGKIISTIADLSANSYQTQTRHIQNIHSFIDLSAHLPSPIYLMVIEF